MKATSNTNPQQFAADGAELRITWDVAQVTTDEGGTLYQYHEAIVPRYADRAAIIEAIIAAVYPTYGAEMAAFHNGQESYDAFLAHRVRAKELADAAIAWRDG